MAHLWIDQDGGWSVLPLGTAFVALLKDAARPATDWHAGVEGAAVIGKAASGEWMLCCPPRSELANDWVRINGEPTLIGARVLADRDEIVLGPNFRTFFSTEEIAEVRPFAGLSEPTTCPRDFQKIETGDLCVQCPNCGVYYHQSPELNCWTYDSKCCSCGFDTCLDQNFRWTPEEIR